MTYMSRHRGSVRGTTVEFGFSETLCRSGARGAEGPIPPVTLALPLLNGSQFNMLKYISRKLVAVPRLNAGTRGYPNRRRQAQQRQYP